MLRVFKVDGEEVLALSETCLQAETLPHQTTQQKASLSRAARTLRKKLAAKNSTGQQDTDFL